MCNVTKLESECTYEHEASFAIIISSDENQPSQTTNSIVHLLQR